MALGLNLTFIYSFYSELAARPPTGAVSHGAVGAVLGIAGLVWSSTAIQHQIQITVCPKL